MGRDCNGCEHPKRKALDAEIVEDALSNNALAKRYGLSRDGVRRHRAHVSASLARVVEDRETAGAVAAFDRLEHLYVRAMRLLDAAEADGRASLSLQAIRELRGITETLAKITGELDDRPQVAVINLGTNPEFVAMVNTLMDALLPYPEAREVVVGRLAEGGPS